MMRYVVSAAILMALPFAVFAHEFAAEGIKIDHPWARPTVTTRQPAAVFFHLDNNGEADDRLLAAKVPESVAASAELHTTMNDEGVLRMRPLTDGISIPAGEEVPVAPGGHHVMLFDLAEPLSEGMRFPVTLTFEKAGDVEVEVVVETPTDGADEVDHSDHQRDGE
ncbi:MAG: copper chaperone PCu(A)C [Pseudomonadota bacterium]